MKAVAVELRVELSEARVVLGDGELRRQRIVLGKDALFAVRDQLAPLLDHLKARAGGPVFAVSIDQERGTLVAAGGQGGVRLTKQEVADVQHWVEPLVEALGAIARKTVTS